MQLRMLLSFLLLSFMALSFTTSSSIPLIDGLILLLAILSIHTGSFTRQFITLLSLSLAFGFFLLFYALFTHASLTEQVNYLLRHILVTVSMVLIWLTYGITSRYRTENIALKEKIQTLEKYAGSSQLLTLAEFKSRVKLISTGTRRRNEQNYYVLVSIVTPDKKSETTVSTSHIVSEGILGSIRAEFDLVTQVKGEQFLIFLQNTNESGCHIVIDRLMGKLREQFNLIDPPLICEIIEEDKIESILEMNTPSKGVAG
ncbi:hypothetical protein CHH69_05635 [Terribacillus saccharophilus]|nr:hypothetical protein CHH51_08910 [Terribacillus saccharophilus]PAF23572.1 hypothetical protein CHH49_03175 [Terribacillus saccharophilus]PAF37254.1 hypothetical protein CHH58_10500 [Terribacillus saccharophilus]PAF39917.1 hypothetical protein CHH69_05635 [Terribacillus saccharophilus]